MQMIPVAQGFVPTTSSSVSSSAQQLSPVVASLDSFVLCPTEDLPPPGTGSNACEMRKRRPPVFFTHSRTKEEVQMLVHVLVFLDIMELVRLRSVCSSWKKAIDGSQYFFSPSLAPVQTSSRLQSAVATTVSPMSASRQLLRAKQPLCPYPSEVLF